MKNLSPFQIILLVVSGIVIVVGVAVFAFSRSAANQVAGNVEVWGTVSEENFKQLNDYLKDVKKLEQTVTYRYIEPANFDRVFTEALAEGNGPDVVMMSDDRLVRHEAKLLQVEYEFFPERTFKDTFVEAGEIFTDENGVYAFPFLIDPLVMYWNRAIFTESGKSQPPRYWDEMLTLVPQLTKKESDLTIEQSALALGDYQNVNHAKQILLTLFMQAGNNVVYRNPATAAGVDTYQVTLDDKFGFAVAPAQAAVNFYTQFADPSRAVYTWNRSLPSSLDSFIAGDTAVYFGFASEFASVRQKNPNLNFDVAVIPQSRSGRSVTYGRVLGLAMPKNIQNIEAPYAFMQSMIEPDVVAIASDILFLPPVRRDLLAGDPSNAFMQTFHDSALLAKSFYDFDPVETDDIFQRMIESVVSGRLDTIEAVLRANEELNLIKP